MTAVVEFLIEKFSDVYIHEPRAYGKASSNGNLNAPAGKVNLA